jgi:hypothetical protein
VFGTRINVIIVRTLGHRIEEFNPPENIHLQEDIWLIYMVLGHTHHYLSTTKTLNVTPSIPPPTTGANTNSGRTRRSTDSTPTPSALTNTVRSTSKTRFQHRDVIMVLLLLVQQTLPTSSPVYKRSFFFVFPTHVRHHSMSDIIVYRLDDPNKYMYFDGNPPNPPLGFSLSSHRHSYIGPVFNSRFID